MPSTAAAPSWVRFMTTSSSDTSRCTRISPSAVLDDRLDGKDLEWARDHLRRCEACRERVEDFREMLLRVGRLPKATVGPTAMDQAFAAAIPEQLRDEIGSRPFEFRTPDDARLIPPTTETPAPMYPEITSVPDLMTELEREIFRDEPVQDHPTPLTATPEPAEPAAAESQVEQTVDEPVEEEPSFRAEPVVADEDIFDAWRQVPIDSHREPEPNPATLAPQTEPESEPIAWLPKPEPEPQLEPIAEPAVAVDSRERANVIYDDVPALTFAEPEETLPTPPRKSDTAMRLAVGLGAAACVLLAAVLYEGGYLLKLGHSLSATAPTVHASIRPSASAPRTTVSASATAPPTTTAPPATVLYTLGDGASGGAVFRIRPGTAIAGYTRLVFDMHGNGLPSMIVTRPDDSHIQVFFKNTTVTGVAVNGIRSYQIAAVEPGVQQGADGSFLIDLAHPVRVTAFTLPATGSYAWRLVVDLHTS